MSISAYPLDWPQGVPRTVHTEPSRFSHNRKPVSVEYARREVERNLWLHDACGLVISTNLRLRLDGLPRSGQPEPHDTGVAVYFKLDGVQQCIPCDRWYRVADNLYAIAKAVDALRGLDRWVNASMVAAAFKGFTALPSPEQMEDWRQVFGFGADEVIDRRRIRERYRVLSLVAHPDKGGSDEGMARLNRAREEALRVTAYD